MPPEPPPPRGKGLLITGISIMAGVAAPATIAGAYCSFNGSDDLRESDCTKPEGHVALIVGLMALGVSTPMIVFGARRTRRYAEWKRERRISVAPSTGRTALGTHTAGFRLRF